MRFENRALPIVLAAVLIDTIGFGIVLPVFPALLTRLGHIDLEAATRVAGYMLAAFAVAQFFAGPVLGNLSDRYGRRPVLIAAMLAFGLDYALMAVAPTLAWLFVGRIIAGIAGAVYGPANSVIADITPPEKRAAAFGYVSGAFGIGFILGPALGGMLAGWGASAPFIAAALLAFGNAAAMALLMPETLSREHRRPFHWRDAHIVGAFKPLLRMGNALPLIGATFLWQLAHMVYPSTWAFWAAIRFQWSAHAIGWSLGYAGLVMALVQVALVGPAITRIGEARALVLGLICGGVGFFGFVFVTAGWQVYPIMALSALSGFVSPAISGLCSRMVGPSQQGALQGGFGSLGSIASVVSPLLMTQALAGGVAVGLPGAAFLLAALLAAVALSLVIWKVRTASSADTVAPA